MSKLLHIEGVNDEVLDAAMVAGLIYLLWKSGQHVAAVVGPQGPAGPAGPVGPPATVIPPPPGGHLDPVRPPAPAPKPVNHNPVTGHVPPPIGHRDYYHGAPSTPPAKPVAAICPVPLPEIVTTSANYSTAAHTRPKKKPAPAPKPKTTSGHIGQPPHPAVTAAKPAAHSRPVAY